MVSFFGAKAAVAAGEEVFLDEGDGDFATVPKTASAEKNVETKTAQAEQKPETDFKKTEAEAGADPETLAPKPEAKKATATHAQKSAPATKPVAAKAPTPTAKVAKASTNTSARKPASVSAATGVGGFVETTRSCPMLRAPASTDEPVSFTKFPRKVWSEKMPDGWFKVFAKSGEAAYIAPDCAK